MNKRGVFFSLYLIFITIVMIGLVIGLYLKQQDNVNSSLVSPVEVLQLGDNLKVFELKEDEIANSLLSEKDPIKFKKLFLDKVESDLDMKEFLLDVDYKGVENPQLEYRSFLEKVVYKEFEFKDGKMKIKRSTLSKTLELNPIKESVPIKFPVTVYFDFDREFKV